MVNAEVLQGIAADSAEYSEFNQGLRLPKGYPAPFRPGRGLLLVKVRSRFSACHVKVSTRFSGIASRVKAGALVAAFAKVEIRFSAVHLLATVMRGPTRQLPSSRRRCKMPLAVSGMGSLRGTSPSNRA